MADPVVVPCAADAWQLVANNVTSCKVRRYLTSPPKYSFTYTATGNPAPTDLSTAAPLIDGEQLTFGAAADVYVYAHGVAGSVRVDT